MDLADQIAADLTHEEIIDLIDYIDYKVGDWDFTEAVHIWAEDRHQEFIQEGYDYDRQY